MRNSIDNQNSPINKRKKLKKKSKKKKTYEKRAYRVKIFLKKKLQ